MTCACPLGERWAAKVMPQVLMQLMRHESINTTMAYYVGRNAQATADILWGIYLDGNQGGKVSQGTNPAGKSAIYGATRQEMPSDERGGNGTSASTVRVSEDRLVEG